jgi:acetyl esterase
VRGLASLPPSVLRRLVGQPVAVDGQELHPETQLALKLIELAREPELKNLDPAQARERVARDARTFEGPKVPVARVEELQLSGAAGRLAARLYAPRASAPPPGDGTPGLVYYHGGGFVVGDLDTHDNVCRFLATQAGVRVIAVDYRLAPESRFPAAIDDAVAALRDVVGRAGELEIDPQRIAVGGDSAGGNLAAGVAQAMAHEDGVPAFQLLFYPWLDLSHKRRSYSLFREGFYLTESDLDWYREHYVGGDEDAADPRCSPLLAQELAGVAPAYIATAGFDPLRDEGEEYAQRLIAAGVPVALHRQAKLIHGFANTISLGHVGREAVIQAAGALRVGLAAPRRAEAALQTAGASQAETE